MKHLCRNFETAEMVRAKKDAVIEYRGHQAKVRAVDGWHCPECGEIQFVGKEGERCCSAGKTAQWMQQKRKNSRASARNSAYPSARPPNSPAAV